MASLKSPVEIEHVTGGVGQTARTMVPDVVGRSLLGDDVPTDTAKPDEAFRAMGEIAEEKNSAIVFPAQFLVGARAGERFVAGSVRTGRALAAPDDPADGAVAAHAGPSVKAPHETSQDCA
ncbi:hypothetical protein [Streptomyces albicerus]|uniref:hypothetical protein n=1 Tax=Streptomyces albicerus TaxID=2569859 RepID=UPI00124B0ECE|nr:hypothetical protein [Streptomyces albicerus]